MIRRARNSSDSHRSLPRTLHGGFVLSTLLPRRGKGCSCVDPEAGFVELFPPESSWHASVRCVEAAGDPSNAANSGSQVHYEVSRRFPYQIAAMLYGPRQINPNPKPVFTVGVNPNSPTDALFLRTLISSWITTCKATAGMYGPVKAPLFESSSLHSFPLGRQGMDVGRQGCIHVDSMFRSEQQTRPHAVPLEPPTLSTGRRNVAERLPTPPQRRHAREVRHGHGRRHQSGRAAELERRVYAAGRFGRRRFAARSGTGGTPCLGMAPFFHRRRKRNPT